MYPYLPPGSNARPTPPDDRNAMIGHGQATPFRRERGSSHTEDTPANRVLLIGKLHPDANRSAISLFFSAFKVVDFKRTYNPRLHKHNVVGFVMFSSMEERNQAKELLDGAKLMGRQIELEFAPRGIKVADWGFIHEETDWQTLADTPTKKTPPRGPRAYLDSSHDMDADITPTRRKGKGSSQTRNKSKPKSMSGQKVKSKHVPEDSDVDALASAFLGQSLQEPYPPLYQQSSPHACQQPYTQAYQQTYPQAYEQTYQQAYQQASPYTSQYTSEQNCQKMSQQSSPYTSQQTPQQASQQTYNQAYGNIEAYQSNNDDNRYGTHMQQSASANQAYGNTSVGTNANNGNKSDEGYYRHEEQNNQNNQNNNDTMTSLSPADPYDTWSTMMFSKPWWDIKLNGFNKEMELWEKEAAERKAVERKAVERKAAERKAAERKAAEEEAAKKKATAQPGAYNPVGSWNLAGNDSNDRRFNMVTEDDWYNFEAIQARKFRGYSAVDAHKSDTV